MASMFYEGNAFYREVVSKENTFYRGSIKRTLFGRRCVDADLAGKPTLMN